MARVLTPWSITDKLCLVTGATSGLGAATAAELARRGAHVLLVARDAGRGQATSAAIRAAHPAAQLDVLTCDLSRLDDVRHLARAVEDTYGRLDVLINNAGVINFQRRTTVDGHEHTVAVNHLGPFLLTNLLRAALRVPAEARVVTVASDNHRTVSELPLDDLHSERGFKPLQVYNQTKLMNVWFSGTLAAQMVGTGVTSNCLSPGFVRTGLGRDASGAFALFLRAAAPFQSVPASACRTAVHLATAPGLSMQTGGYYAKCRPATPGGLAGDLAAADRLWDLSAQLTDVA